MNGKLEQVLSKVKAILEEEGVNGIIFVHTPGDAAYLNFTHPSINIIRFDYSGGFHYVLSDDLSQEERIRLVAGTANYLHLAAHHHLLMANALTELSEYFDKTTDSSHGRINHSPGGPSLN